jgi:hypothetical protein
LTRRKETVRTPNPTSLSRGPGVAGSRWYLKEIPGWDVRDWPELFANVSSLTIQKFAVEQFLAPELRYLVCASSR